MDILLLRINVMQVFNDKKNSNQNEEYNIRSQITNHYAVIWEE